MAVDRKCFLGMGGLALAGLAARRALGALTGSSLRPSPGDQPRQRARRWAMVIDARKCLESEACDRCIRACHASHNVPQIGDRRHEIKWIWKEPFKAAFISEQSPYANASLQPKPFLVLCNHCNRPPCVRVCPTRATWKRDDGIVMMDWHRCIGCRYCMAACPYGSRSFNWEDPRASLERLSPEYPTRTKGVVEKCTFCPERLAQGKPPACVEACDRGALMFGDLEDPVSAVRKVLDSRFAIRRKVELGTDPEVYYIV